MKKYIPITCCVAICVVLIIYVVQASPFSRNESNKQSSGDSSFSQSIEISPTIEEGWNKLAESSRLTKYVAAYKAEDTSELSENEKIVLNSAVGVISSIITDDMTTTEKALKVHDYIIKNCTYDIDRLDEMVGADPLSSSAEGFFINGKAICSGYTQTFQLFMDLLEIPCITVNDASASATSEEHSWNVVKIDNQWYYCDLTWDDPIPDSGKTHHNYFLVSSEHMRKSSHNWNEEIYPYAPEAYPFN